MEISKKASKIQMKKSSAVKILVHISHSVNIFYGQNFRCTIQNCLHLHRFRDSANVFQ